MTIPNHVRRAMSRAGASVAVLAVLLAAFTAACQRPTSAQDATAAGAIAVDGSERLQWDQAGATLQEVQGYSYVAVIERRPAELKNVVCAANPSGGGFVCTSEMPALPRGVHRVWIVALLRDGNRVLVSRWTPPLTLHKR